MKRFNIAWAAAVAGLIVLAACSREEARPESGRLRVAAGIPPIGYVAERIGGGHVEVTVLLAPGQNPHSYEPSPRQVADLGKAKIFFKAGLPFEERLAEKMVGGGLGLKVVDVGAGIEKRMAEEHTEHAEEGEEDGDHHDHHAGEPDPHIWLSPPLLVVIAENVARALAAADPERAADFQRELAGFSAEVQAAHERLTVTLAPYRGRTFYVFHPAFGYFGDAYGLRQEAVEAGGKTPTPKQLEDLIARARAEGVKVIFVQPQFDSRSAETVAAAIGGAVVPMDDLAPDVTANFEDMARKLERALK